MPVIYRMHGKIKNRVIMFFVVFELLAYLLIQIFYNLTYSDQLLQQKSVEIKRLFAVSAMQITRISQQMEDKATALAISGEQLYRQQQRNPQTLTALQQEAGTILLSQFSDFTLALGGGIWFEPFRLLPEQRLFGPYFFWQDQQPIVSWELNSDDYNYPSQDWYTVANAEVLDQPEQSLHPLVWSDPYFDEAGTFSMMITVDALMRDENGGYLGMATIDWALSNLNQVLQNHRPTPLTQSYLVHRASDTVVNLVNDDKSFQRTDSFYWASQLAELQSMQQARQSLLTAPDGESYLMFHQRAGHEFDLISLTPLSELKKEINRFAVLVASLGGFIALAFMILMFWLIRFVFSPFDKVLKLINQSIQMPEHNQVDVKINPINYNEDNEFTPIVQALNRVYLQIDNYLQQITRNNQQLERSRADYLQLNEQLEEKVTIRTRELEAKHQAMTESLQRLKDAQQQMVEQEKHASLGKLVAGVAHEINTPLGVSVTAITTLEHKVKNIIDKYNDGSLRKKDFQLFCDELVQVSDIVTANLERAALLVQSFKQVAVDQSSEQCRSIELGDYLDQVIRSLAPKLKHSPHQLIFTPPTDPVQLYVAPGAVAQVITNIVDNALAHAFQQTPHGKITLSISQHGDKAKIIIADNGAGMDKDTLRQLYEPFFTTARNTGGSGLGMHLVYNLVHQQLKGTIKCKSAVGKGTEYTILLPLDVRTQKPDA